MTQPSSKLQQDGKQKLTKGQFWPWWVVGAMLLSHQISRTVGDRHIVINRSPSLPSGLYLRTDQSLNLGQIVEIQLPTAAHDYYQQSQRINPHEIYLIKPIAATAGDTIDTTGEWLIINDRQMAPILTLDSQGHSLPVWRAHYVLQEDEYFLFSDRVPNSFDSRYFGPVSGQQILSVREPLWTW